MPYVPSTCRSASMHRLLEIPVERLLDEVREHFGVGLRRELVAQLLEHLRAASP